MIIRLALRQLGRTALWGFSSSRSQSRCPWICIRVASAFCVKTKGLTSTIAWISVLDLEHKRLCDGAYRGFAQLHIEPVFVYFQGSHSSLASLQPMVNVVRKLTAATSTKSSPDDGIAVSGSVAVCSECAVFTLPRHALEVSGGVLSFMASE